MDIKVLGPGCAKCKTTADLINRVATEVGKSVNIQKIENMRQIANYGVMSTPAVVIGDRVVHKGSVPSHDQVRTWLE